MNAFFTKAKYLFYRLVDWVTLGIPNGGLELVLGSVVHQSQGYWTVALPSLMAHSFVVLDYL